MITRPTMVNISQYIQILNHIVHLKLTMLYFNYTSIKNYTLMFFKDIINGGTLYKLGFPGGSVLKKLPANAGGIGSIPGLGRSPGAGNGNPLQYSCLGNSMDRGAWQTTIYGVAKESDMS